MQGVLKEGIRNRWRTSARTHIHTKHPMNILIKFQNPKEILKNLVSFQTERTSYIQFKKKEIDTRQSYNTSSRRKWNNIHTRTEECNSRILYSDQRPFFHLSRWKEAIDVSYLGKTTETACEWVENRGRWKEVTV